MSDEPEYSGNMDVCQNCKEILEDRESDWCDICLGAFYTGGRSQVAELAGRAWDLIERGKTW
jgi:hypothetical protein